MPGNARRRNALIALALVYGVLSGLCWPSAYTLTHWLIDYHAGFGKRGLLGLVLEHIDKPPYHYNTLVTMAGGVLLGWLAVLAALAWRPAKADAGLAGAIVVFFLSAGFASLVCDTGRGEHFGLLLGLPCLLMPASRPWLATRALLLVVAVLIQEINLLIAAPVVMFDVWAAAAPGSRRRGALYAGLCAAPAAALTLYLGLTRTGCDAAASMAYFQHMAADFQVQPVPLATLCMDAPANLHLVSTFIWSYAVEIAVLASSLLVIMPSTLVNLALAATIMRGKLAWGLTAGTLAALAPLALLAMGSDLVRFASLVQATSLLVLVAAARRTGLPQGGTLRGGWVGKDVLAGVAVLELGSVLTLNSGAEMLKFPFTPLIQQLLVHLGYAAPA